jgi:Reverse transcriptase (RNA-dependent DNA polymerase)
LVLASSDYNVIGCRWILKVKRRSDGSIEHYKARLMAKDFHQQGLDFLETFSPIIRRTIIQLILSIVVSLDWPLRQLDMHNVFLHEDLNKQVSISQLPGFINPSQPNHVCWLSKFLYGLKAN